MSNWQSQRVAVNGTEMFVTITGGDKPPLLLAHGFTDNGLCWSRSTRALEEDYNIIMPDVRGHGHTPNPDHPYTSEQHAADLAALLKALDVGPAAVMGHSMGAGNAWLLAESSPELVSRVILIDPPWHLQAGQGKERTEMLQEWKANLAALQQQPREAIIALGHQENPNWHPIEIETWADSKLQFDLRTFDLYEIMPRDWQDIAAGVRCPVLLMTADVERGGLVTPDIAAQAAELVPTLRAIHIVGTGHSIQRDQFDEYIAAVRAFLAEA